MWSACGVYKTVPDIKMLLFLIFNFFFISKPILFGFWWALRMEKLFPFITLWTSQQIHTGQGYWVFVAFMCRFQSNCSVCCPNTALCTLCCVVTSSNWGHMYWSIHWYKLCRVGFFLPPVFLKAGVFCYRVGLIYLTRTGLILQEPAESKRRPAFSAGFFYFCIAYQFYFFLCVCVQA